MCKFSFIGGPTLHSHFCLLSAAGRPDHGLRFAAAAADYIHTYFILHYIVFYTTYIHITYFIDRNYLIKLEKRNEQPQSSVDRRLPKYTTKFNHAFHHSSLLTVDCLYISHSHYAFTNTLYFHLVFWFIFTKSVCSWPVLSRNKQIKTDFEVFYNVIPTTIFNQMSNTDFHFSIEHRTHL